MRMSRLLPRLPWHPRCANRQEWTMTFSPYWRNLVDPQVARKATRSLGYDKGEAFPAVGPTDQNVPAPLPRRNSDDGRITTTSTQSRIRPLFANIVRRSADQARAVQGRKPAGHQGPRDSKDDGNLTRVAVIRFGGLENDEEELKFRARNPIEIVQAVQRDLAKRSKNPPAVLSGRWSTSVESTGNFVYTLAGVIPPKDLMALKPYLCGPFKGHTELVPTKGWTWLQPRQVPTEDLDHCVWGPDDLYKAFIANPCFQDALVCVPPHWQGNPLNNDKEKLDCHLHASRCDHRSRMTFHGFISIVVQHVRPSVRP
ncbi:hypothetical protein V8E53_007056 [Lactarius tabidus]